MVKTMFGDLESLRHAVTVFKCDNYFSSFSLRDIMLGNIDSPLYAEDPVETLIMEDIMKFPVDIKGCQATCAWLTVYKEIEDKRKQAL